MEDIDFFCEEEDSQNSGEFEEEWIAAGELIPMDDADFLFGASLSGDGLNGSSSGAFLVASRKQVWKELQKLGDLLKEELGLKSKWDAILILRVFKFSVDRLHAEYFDNVKRWREKAGVPGRRRSTKRGRGGGGAGDNDGDGDGKECEICFMDIENEEDGLALKCGHGPYCKDCWGQHIHTIASSGSGADMAAPPCMGPSCKLRMNFARVRKVAVREDTDRCQYFLVKEYVEGSRNLSFCPAGGCQMVLKHTGDGRPMVCARCECGQRFCFACGNEDHNPITCAQLAKWAAKNLDDDESLKLVTATSKACFHCGIPTQRIDGCNHMQCRSCGGHWCWMCRGDWKTHGQHTGGFYSCNRYEASAAKKADLEAAAVKEDLDRYLHYFNRYFNHDQKKNDVDNLMETVERTSQAYRELTNGNADFFKEAVDLLLRCRHILKYTYVYGYYLPDGSKGKTFFEYLQANAEGITERLADSITATLPKDAQDLAHHVSTFKDRLRFTKTYINNLVRGIEDGLGVEGLGTIETNDSKSKKKK